MKQFTSLSTFSCTVEEIDGNAGLYRGFLILYYLASSKFKTL